MEYKIGDRIEIGEVALQVVEVDTFFCDKCYFNNDPYADRIPNGCRRIGVHGIAGACGYKQRTDGKSVIFKQDYPPSDSGK